MTICNLQKCNSSSYLTTKQKLKRASRTEPVVFRGQDPRNVPVYVLYREHNNFLDVAYWLLFPCNREKRVLFVFGNHVGDWEHVMVRFRKNSSDYPIYSMFLSIHNSKITKKFGGESVLWKDGKFRKGSQSLTMYELGYYARSSLRG